MFVNNHYQKQARNAVVMAAISFFKEMVKNSSPDDPFAYEKASKYIQRPEVVRSQDIKVAGFHVNLNKHPEMQATWINTAKACATHELSTWEKR